MRIASLLPSATEIVCALGLEDELIGVTHECDYPASVRAKPVLTRSLLAADRSGLDVDRHIRGLVHQGSSIYALDAGLLTALAPDLILTQELCEVCAVSYPIVERAARRLGSSLVSLEPERLGDVLDNIRSIGRLAGRTEAAEQLCTRLRARVATIETRVAGRRRRRVVCLEWVDPPYNCGHWTPELIAIAGGDERLGVAGRPARPVEWQMVVDAEPEVIVVIACGFSLERSLDEIEAAGRRFASLAAELWVVDGSAYFSRPGPRLVDSVEIMAGILHPEVVDPPRPAAARRVSGGTNRRTRSGKTRRPARSGGPRRPGARVVPRA